MEAKVEGTPTSRPWRSWRWGTAGALLFVAVLVVVLFLGMISARRMLGWGMRRITAAVISAVPPETPAAERESLRVKLECVARAADEGRADERRLGEFARACTDALEDRKLTPLELARIEALATAVCLASGEEGGR